VERVHPSFAPQGVGAIKDSLITALERGTSP
jgi:hypothetical protein